MRVSSIKAVKTMYDKLIADLKGDAEWAAANEWETPIMLSDHIRQAIEAIETLSMKLMGDEAAIAGMKREIERMVVAGKTRWIPISEQIPEEYTTILFITGCGDLHVGFYDSEHKSYCDMTGFRFVCTHWMLAPELPMEDKNNV